MSLTRGFASIDASCSWNVRTLLKARIRVAWGDWSTRHEYLYERFGANIPRQQGLHLQRVRTDWEEYSMTYKQTLVKATWIDKTIGLVHSGRGWPGSKQEQEANLEGFHPSQYLWIMNRWNQEMVSPHVLMAATVCFDNAVALSRPGFRKLIETESGCYSVVGFGMLAFHCLDSWIPARRHWWYCRFLLDASITLQYNLFGRMGSLV